MANLSRVYQWAWAIANVGLAILALISWGSDVWEAYLFLFVLSAGSQALLYWRTKKPKAPES
jgi:hypothetical protein